jgi:predicted DNA-binding protein (MmcQ/YjbR family)
MKYCIVWFKGRKVYTLKNRLGEIKQYQEITLKQNPEIARELLDKEDVETAVDGVKYYVSYELFEELT